MTTGPDPDAEAPRGTGTDTSADNAVDQAHAERLAALRQWLARGRRPSTVGLVQTHLSSLLFAGDRVFKLKRPRRLAFVDFGPLAARRAACEAEWRLNRRTAPAHYLAVRPLCQTDQGLRLGDALSGLGGPERARAHSQTEAQAEAEACSGGPVVDWVLEMRRFDPAQGLDRRAVAGRLSLAQVEAVAEAVVRFHQTLAPAAPADAEAADPKRLRAMVAANMCELLTLAPAGWQTRLQRLAQWQQRRGAALSRRMRARQAQGRVRDCHGDLHLGNLAWWWPDRTTASVARTMDNDNDTPVTMSAGRHGAGQGQPLLFDALEFDAALRHTDTVADVAFVFMDLMARAGDDLAWAFLNRVLSMTGDAGQLALLPWWAVHRALVRAKVARLSAVGADRSAQQALARRYLGVAERLAALQPVLARPVVGAGGASAGQGVADPGWRPGLVVMMGLSGSGKSVAARAIGQHLGAVVWRSDVERKRLFGRGELERPTAADPIYGRQASARTYARLGRLVRASLAAGLHTVVDAACLRVRERLALAAVADSLGCPHGLLWCEAPAGPLAARVQARARAGRDASDATVAVLAQQRDRLEAPVGAERARLQRLDASGTLAQTRQRARRAARAWLQPPPVGV